MSKKITKMRKSDIRIHELKIMPFFEDDDKKAQDDIKKPGRRGRAKH
jgi:hypothetical protein